MSAKLRCPTCNNQMGNLPPVFINREEIVKTEDEIGKFDCVYCYNAKNPPQSTLYDSQIEDD